MKDFRSPAPKAYVPVRFYSTELVYRAVPATEELPTDEEGEVTFKWDWRFVERSFLHVLLGICLSPTKERPEQVEATFVGAFRLPTEEPDVLLDAFVRVNGPTMLMPYLREAISSLTSRGFFGAFLIPPVNIHNLIAGMDTSATGTRQVAEDAEMAAIAERLNPKRALSKRRKAGTRRNKV